jgi:hypothetical protein
MKYFWGSVISELRQKRRFERHFRSALNNGHRQQGSVGPVRANNGSPSFDHLVTTGEASGQRVVIRAARLAATLLRIARGIRHADKVPARL